MYCMIDTFFKLVFMLRADIPEEYIGFVFYIKSTFWSKSILYVSCLKFLWYKFACIIKIVKMKMTQKNSKNNATKSSINPECTCGVHQTIVFVMNEGLIFPSSLFAGHKTEACWLDPNIFNRLCLMN